MYKAIKSHLLLPFLLLLSISAFLIVPEARAQVAAPIPYENAAISSADAFATQAGIEIFRKGGNAIDAAIAVQFALAVTLPRAGNIGGGGFMMLHLANGDVKALDFREKAPSRATRTMFLDDDGNYVPELSRTGGLASGVPGTVDGMISALERHGTLPLEVILEPAMRLAKNGFKLTHSHAESLNRHSEQFHDSSRDRDMFFSGLTARPWRAGHVLIQPDLAETFERIATAWTRRLLLRDIPHASLLMNSSGRVAG